MLQIDTQQSIAYWQFYWIGGGGALFVWSFMTKRVKSGSAGSVEDRSVSYW